MASQSLATRPESPVISKVPTENRPPPQYENLNLQAPANLRFYTPQAEGRDKAMDNDIVNMVTDKLETVVNLIDFYWYAHEKTGFNKDSINGLCLILCDCITQLREAVK